MVILTLFFGSAIADVVWTDFIPVRPYHEPFTFAGSQPGRDGLVTDLLLMAFIILLASQLISQIANRTTGIVIAHTGFTPNTNITGSPGVAPLLQIVPFLFAAILTFGMLKLASKHKPGGL